MIPPETAALPSLKEHWRRLEHMYQKAPVDVYFQSTIEQGRNGMARPGFEPGTPRFSVVCSTN
jgi:hypothetical protein